MEWPPDQLKQVSAAVHSGGDPQSCTVRELLSWYSYERRGNNIVWVIRRDLVDLKLRTEPDIEYAYIDARIRFYALHENPVSSHEDESNDASLSLLGIAESDDPTHRIGKLTSANTRPMSVNPNATIAEAVTLMLLHDYSQLLVMQGDRGLKGVVTWQSIGTRAVLGKSCSTVQECLEEAVVVGADASLFSALSAIAERGFVLVRDAQNTISGIVTTADLSLQFRQLAEPFLLLGEIEKHLRRIGSSKFSIQEISDIKDPSDASRTIENVSDLTFGEHVRLLENPTRWTALKLNIDRTTFVRHLNEVRDIRNNVMHFDPDGTAPSELDKLRNFVRLLGALGM